MNQDPLVLACGPRPGGNSDLAAKLLVQGLERAGVAACLVYLRETEIRPCLGCQGCAQAPGQACALKGLDEAEELFGRILGARLVFFTSPIYFYHFPGNFKCFIDRAQRYYQARLAGDPALNPEKPRQGLACLVAGRERGEKLFTGALLTLRYFLWALGMVPGQALCLPGLDGPRDLAADQAAQDRIKDYAALAWRDQAR